MLLSQTLSKALVEEYALNNTIIVTFANANHIDYTLNWVSYLRALHIDNYIVGAVDDETAQAMAHHHVHHFIMYGSEDVKQPEPPAGYILFAQTSTVLPASTIPLMYAVK